MKTNPYGISHPGHIILRTLLREQHQPTSSDYPEPMSRAFVKNDAVDDRILVPPRPPLPPGAVNYVTPRGVGLLRDELAGLEAERARAQCSGNDEAERTRRLASLAQRIAEVSARIASAKIVDPLNQPRDEVRFGATVTVRTLTGKVPGEERRITIVGVDEAEPSAGRVSFIAPIARTILGCRAGETTPLRTAQGEELLEIIEIEYLP